MEYKLHIFYRRMDNTFRYPITVFINKFIQMIVIEIKSP